MGMLILVGSACSTNRQRSVRQMVIQWDNIRLLEDDWARFWLVDEPSQLNKHFED